LDTKSFRAASELLVLGIRTILIWGLSSGLPGCIQFLINSGDGDKGRNYRTDIIKMIMLGRGGNLGAQGLWVANATMGWGLEVFLRTVIGHRGSIERKLSNNRQEKIYIDSDSETRSKHLISFESGRKYDLLWGKIFMEGVFGRFCFFGCFFFVVGGGFLVFFFEGFLWFFLGFWFFCFLGGGGVVVVGGVLKRTTET